MHALTFALRQLMKSPGFTLVAILTLTLGIGVNTAIFSLVDSLFLRGLPFEEPNRLVRIYGEAPERNLRQLPFSVPRFSHIRDGQDVFTEMAADSGGGFTLTGLGEAVQLNGARVTSNYFSLLGVQAMKGRLFRPEEESTADVAVVSEAFWRTRLGADANIIGRSVTLDGVPHTIVGVIPEMPVTWFGPNAEVWTTKPFELPGLSRELMMRGVSFMRGIARLKPGVTLEQAHAALVVLQESYRRDSADRADNSWAPTVVSAVEDTTANLRPAFGVLLGAVGFVLLIACSNVANLLLVRFSARRREIAVRVALGAPRGGIVRLFITESILMSVIAGVFGLLLATWILSAVPALAGDNLPLGPGVELNWPVLLFTLGLSFVTGIAMGVYPAWQGSRTDVVDGLKDGGRAATGGPGQQRFRRILLGAQVALSLVLLVGAGLLIASFVRLQRQDGGFDGQRLWLGGINLPSSPYPDADSRQRFTENLIARLLAAPGIEGAIVGQGLPMTGNNSRAPYALADGEPVPMNKRPLGLMRSHSPGFLKTLGVPLIAGREFDDRDLAGRQDVVLISAATAKRLFPNQNPIGRRFYFGTNNGTGLLTEVIGVVGDVRSVALRQENEVEFYRPWAQRNFPFVQVMIKTAGDPASAIATIRAVLKSIDADLPVIQPTTMDALLEQSLGQQRLLMTLLSAFAGLALLLAVVGIYSLVASTVGQRTAEIGVRMALGAQPADVLKLLIRQGMTPVTIGLGAGIVAALILGYLIREQLYDVSAHDPILLGGTCITLGVVALLACWLPARRAMRINPVNALRAQ